MAVTSRTQTYGSVGLLASPCGVSLFIPLSSHFSDCHGVLWGGVSLRYNEDCQPTGELRSPELTGTPHTMSIVVTIVSTQ